MHEIQSISFLLAENFQVFGETFKRMQHAMQQMQHDMVGNIKHVMTEHIVEVQGRLMDRIDGKVYGGVILLRLHELLRVTYPVT